MDNKSKYVPISDCYFQDRHEQSQIFYLSCHSQIKIYNLTICQVESQFLSTSRAHDSSSNLASLIINEHISIPIQYVDCNTKNLGCYNQEWGLLRTKSVC